MTDQISARITEAARLGDAEEVIRLAQSNPFIPAAACTEKALLTACEYGHLSVVRACISDLKCNPNCVDSLGRSPLHMSVVRKGNGKVAVSIIKLLTLNGAKIRKSVLHVCANDFTVFPLLDLKADLNAKSVDGLTPIAVAIASDRQEVVAELIRAKCDIDDSLFFKARSPSVVHELVRAGLNVNVRDIHGQTPLHYAVESNNRRLARTLLECKADATMVASGASSQEGLKSDTIETRTNSAQVSRSSSSASFAPKLVSFEDVSGSVNLLRNFLRDSASLSPDKLVSSQPGDWTDIEQALSEALELTKTIHLRISDHKKRTSGSATLCVVCRVSQKSVVLLPCKHMCCCGTCAKALFRGTWEEDEATRRNLQGPMCPICRSVVETSVNVYT